MHTLQAKYESCITLSLRNMRKLLFLLKSYQSSWFFSHLKVETCQLMENVGSLASSKVASATTTTTPSLRATDLQESQPPCSWIPMLWQRPFSLQIQHDVIKIVNWLAAVHSPAILSSEILSSV